MQLLVNLVVLLEIVVNLFEALLLAVPYVHSLTQIKQILNLHIKFIQDFACLFNGLFLEATHRQLRLINTDLAH